MANSTVKICFAKPFETVFSTWEIHLKDMKSKDEAREKILAKITYKPDKEKPESIAFIRSVE